MSDSDNSNTKNKWWMPHDVPMLVMTILGTLVVLAYCSYTKDLVEETQIANGIAQKAVFLANRPYVMWNTYVINENSELPGRHEWRISAAVHNFGKTPAVDVIGKICDPRIRQDVAQPSFNDCPISEKIDQITIIGPEQTTNITGPAITDEEFTAIVRGQRLLYIYGDIRYSDGVTHHIWATRFCHQVQIQLAPLPMGVRERVITIGCHDRNWICIDENCPPPPQ